MKIHPFHPEILEKIKERSGLPTQHTFSDSYLGNSHVRYPISMPVLRSLAKEFFFINGALPVKEVVGLITSLVQGESFTEKVLAGIMLDYLKKAQRDFDPKYFDKWLDHLEGWAEIDALCTGKFTQRAVNENFERWKPLVEKLNKSKNVVKRRASLVLLCSPISHSTDDEMAQLAFRNITTLKHEKDILITKAISWLLRSMVRHHKKKVERYVNENKNSLPSIAVRETTVKLKTGKKTTPR